MDDLKEQITQLKIGWQALKSDLTEENQQKFIPGITIPQLEEVIGVISEFFERTKAPQGFAPTFKLAKALALGSLYNAVRVCKEINDSTDLNAYLKLPSFVNSINQTIVAFHSLRIYSDKHDTDAALNMQMREGLTLLDTAQAELKRKLDQLDAAKRLGEQIESSATEASELLEKSRTKVAGIHEFFDESKEQIDYINAERVEIANVRGMANALYENMVDAKQKLDDQRAEIKRINEASDEQSKLINHLLPGATSAGLASAFAERARKLELTKWIWFGVFLFSIISLMFVASKIIGISLDSKTDPWIELLHRLPLVTPLIWLGWFSALQYGNTIRVQEDYSFKEATSKAFAGYRDHMEHLANISPQDSSTALELLAANTIQILGKEPLRIYDKPYRDVTPLQTLLSFARIRAAQDKRKSEGKATET